MLAQPRGHEPTVFELADADGRIEMLGHDVDETLGVFHLDHHLGMGHGKTGHDRAEPASPHRGGHGQPQPAAHLVRSLRGLLLRLSDQQRGMAHLLHQTHTVIGKAQLPGGALHQAHAQARLQRSQALGHHRGVLVQHPPRSRERTLGMQRQQRGEFIGVLAVEQVHRAITMQSRGLYAMPRPFTVKAPAQSPLATGPAPGPHAPQSRLPADSAARPAGERCRPPLRRVHRAHAPGTQPLWPCAPPARAA